MCFVRVARAENVFCARGTCRKCVLCAWHVPKMCFVRVARAECCLQRAAALHNTKHSIKCCLQRPATLHNTGNIIKCCLQRGATLHDTGNIIKCSLQRGATLHDTGNIINCLKIRMFIQFANTGAEPSPCLCAMCVGSGVDVRRPKSRDSARAVWFVLATFTVILHVFSPWEVCPLVGVRD